MPLSTIFQLKSWRSVVLVEETGVPGENHRPATSNCIKYHFSKKGDIGPNNLIELSQLFIEVPVPNQGSI
jgi:hypothetical protein